MALCRLDRDVAEQELDLIQFAACEVAKTGARAPEVVRGQLVDAGRCSGLFGDLQPFSSPMVRQLATADH